MNETKNGKSRPHTHICPKCGERFQNSAHDPELALRLRRLRTVAGMTRAEVATIAGVSQQMIVNYEMMARSIPPAVLAVYEGPVTDLAKARIAALGLEPLAEVA